jgi:hypothetical protein
MAGRERNRRGWYGATVRGIGRLVFVTVVAAVSFVIALVNFRQPPASECQMESISDPSYQVQFEESPEVNLTVYHLLVTRNANPVTGAQVCMRLDMGGRGNMSGMGASNVAKEVSPGRYEIPIRLVMAGYWRGAVIVTEGDRKPVSIPVEIDVN